LNFVNKTYGLLRGREYRINKYSDQASAGLPRCTAIIIVEDPDYVDSCFKCSILVPAIELLPMIKKLCQPGNQWEGTEISKVAFTKWIFQTDFDCLRPSPLPKYFHDIISPNIKSVLDLPSTTIHCYECDGICEVREFRKEDEIDTLFYKSYIEILECTLGHVLYKKETSMRFSIR